MAVSSPAIRNGRRTSVPQKQYAEAAGLLERRYAKAAHAENMYVWAKALQMAGQNEAAAAKFADFERRSVAESGIADNSNHELVLYYVDDAKKPERALEIASAELIRRHDVHTLGCLAWALHADHQDQQALTQIDKTLAVGVQDPQILYHAGVINLALNHRSKSESYLKDASRRLSTEAERTLSARGVNPSPQGE